MRALCRRAPKRPHDAVRPVSGKLCFAEAVDKATGKKLKRRELKALAHLRRSYILGTRVMLQAPKKKSRSIVKKSLDEASAIICLFPSLLEVMAKAKRAAAQSRLCRC